MEDRESWYYFGCIFRLILRCKIWKLALSLHLLQENQNGLTDSHHVDLRIAPVIPPCDRYLPSGLPLWCWSIVSKWFEWASNQRHSQEVQDLSQIDSICKCLDTKRSRVPTLGTLHPPENALAARWTKSYRWLGLRERSADHQRHGAETCSRFKW